MKKSKKSTGIYDRTSDLKNKLNKFLTELTGTNKQYFDSLTQEQLIDLKLAVSDVNNVFTLKTTLAFTNWMADFFDLKKSEKERLIDNVNQTKPNTNGYDIELTDRLKIIAEIKGTIPINEGHYYGAAQRNSILDDAIKLEKGKKRISNTSDFIKLIGLIDLDDRTDEAIRKLSRPATNVRTKQQIRLDRHAIVHKLRTIDNEMSAEDLTTEYIYIKKIKI